MSLLDLLDDAARTACAVRVLPREAEPVPFGQVWSDAVAAGRWVAARTGPGGSAVVVLSSSTSCLAALFGAWRHGVRVASAPHPGRGMTPAEYRSQISAIVGLVGASLVLVDADMVQDLDNVGAPVATFDDCLAGGPPVAESAGEFVQFTSGSTASPRGVRLTLDSLAANVRGIIAANPMPEVRGCSWLPLSHDMGLIGMTLGVLAYCGMVGGGELTLIRPESFVANPSLWLRTCAARRATVTTAPSFAFGLAARRLGVGEPLDLSSLRVCITGAEMVRADVLRRFEEATDALGFDRGAVCPAYGLAEATLAVTMVRPGEGWRSIVVDTDDLADGRWVRSAGSLEGTEVVSCGRPLDGVEVRVDGDRPDQLGRIEVSSPALFDGYVGDVDHSGPLLTSDVGVMVDGELFVSGRRDDVLVVRGRNLYAVEIERVAAATPSVRDEHCAALPTETGYLLVAERRRGTRWRSQLDDDARSMRSVLSRRFGIGPERVVFVEPGSFPRTPSGKLPRHRIARALADGRLDVTSSQEFATSGARGSDG